MSLRNRARALQKKTGLTYQQALQRVRALGERPATLRRETGWPLEVCDRFLVDGHAPITVVEAPLEARARFDAIGRVCESVRATAAARSVRLVDVSGRVIADAGEPDDGNVFVEASVKTRSRARYARIAAARAVLIVGFDRDETSLGLVRLRMAKAVEELERLLADDEPPMMPPFGSGGGPGGIPSELRVVEPVPAARPKKKPTPIGRKRKRER
jgi:hypothetical protein